VLFLRDRVHSEEREILFMGDYLVRVIAKNVNVRGLACVTSLLVDGACKRHGTAPTASAALGRALTGGALMGALLKTGQRVALKFAGDGPLKQILVEADSDGAVRGYVKAPNVDLPLKEGKLNVADALGRKGLLTVVKDLRLKDPYTGMVRLYSGEIAEDLAFYFSESEQIPSAVGLGVFVEPDGRVSAAGGFLIQSFPPYDDRTVDELIGQINEISGITQFLRAGRKPEDLIDIIFEKIPYDILEIRDLSFRCTCSKERVERALVALGREEILNIIREQGNSDVTCEFCRETYHFTREELDRLTVRM
jgi:molecular chaperone Hsp33